MITEDLLRELAIKEGLDELNFSSQENDSDAKINVLKKLYRLGKKTEEYRDKNIDYENYAMYNNNIDVLDQIRKNLEEERCDEEKSKIIAKIFGKDKIEREMLHYLMINGSPRNEMKLMKENMSECGEYILKELNYFSKIITHNLLEDKNWIMYKSSSNLIKIPNKRIVYSNTIKLRYDKTRLLGFMSAFEEYLSRGIKMKSIRHAIKEDFNYDFKWVFLIIRRYD
jgi:hypothetical protein